MLYLTKGGSWLVLGNSVAIISGLALSVAFANLVPKEVFGTYKFILSIAGIIGAFTLTGMGIAITQAVSRGFEGSLEEGFKKQLKWSVLILFISFSGAAYYFFNKNTTLALSLIVIGIFQPLFSAYVLYSSFLNGKRDFKTNSIYNIVRSLIPAIVIIIVILFFPENVALIILVYFLAITLPVIFYYKRTVAKHKHNHVTDKNTVPFAEHLSVMGILSTVANYIDKILIFHFLGAVQLAIYVFATAIPLELKNFNKILATLVLPKLSNKSMPELRKTLPRKAILSLMISFIVVISYILIAPYIYQLLFPQYLESILYSQVFALILLFTPSILFGQTLVAHMRKSQLYALKIITPSIRIISIIILLPLYGIWGVVSSILIANSVNLMLLIYFFRR